MVQQQLDNPQLMLSLLPSSLLFPFVEPLLSLRLIVHEGVDDGPNVSLKHGSVLHLHPLFWHRAIYKRTKVSSQTAWEDGLIYKNTRPSGHSAH